MTKYNDDCIADAWENLFRSEEKKISFHMNLRNWARKLMLEDSVMTEQVLSGSGKEMQSRASFTKRGLRHTDILKKIEQNSY